jgi:integrase/recombinase XerD
MHSQYKGVYAAYINQFISFKKNLGFKYKTEEKILSYFDQLTIARGEKMPGITKELAEAWKQSKPNESSSYKVHRCTCLNQFASYLCQAGIPSHMLQLPRHKSTFIPHIFSREQMEAVFTVCDALRAKKKEWTRPLLSSPRLSGYYMQPACV